MMWGNAKFIGCGAARNGDGYFFTCYYYPKGNIIGSPVFTIGDPCTKCPSSRYLFLNFRQTLHKTVMII